ncbi:MAG: RNA polymerase factor sigma-54 [Vallitalea sp.]|jgi:RNA polymerase sigma-54 factor|nr:RNA polymerase factor sigma-54 [Vallitalea sp.]
MDYSMDMNISQSQGLIITPQIEQSLNILKMDSDELGSLIEDKLLNNPILEISETYYKKSKYNLTDSVDEYINSIPDEKTYDKDLYKFLLMQLHTHTNNLTNKQINIAEQIIYSINEKGYLPYEPEELANIFESSISDISKIIRLIKSFEPKGIASKNLCECLLFQTKDENIKMLITFCLEEIAANNLSKIISKTNMSIETIINYIKIIKKMNPIPSRGYAINPKNCYIYPDIVVVKNKEGFLIEIVKRKASYLTINNKYLEWINKSNVNENSAKTNQVLLQDAKFLIKAINQRELTLEKIVSTIIKKQIKFFEEGKKYLTVLNMKEIADEIEMHESTVSRAVNNKYLQCRWGIFELKYFFSNKSQQGSYDGNIVMNPHELIKEIIKTEDKLKPLSDEKISQLLKQKGIALSRRTVTKYREQMKIPKSKERIKW